MNYTTTLTSKSQITIPKSVRKKLGLEEGVKIDIFPTLDGGFVGRPKREPDVLKYAGDLAHLDDGRPWKEIREEAERLEAQEFVEKFNKLTTGKSPKLFRIKVKK